MEKKVFDRKKWLLQILNLFANKVEVLCLVGMNGIGKTTIIKTTLNVVKYIYDALCFVECIESNSNYYKISCHILEFF